jgi:hypothetical protein
MSADANYYGQAPATLRIEYRSDGVVRFRVTPLGGHEAVVDLPRAVVEQVLVDIQAGTK